MPLPINVGMATELLQAKKGPFLSPSYVLMLIPSITNPWKREPGTYRGVSEGRTFSLGPMTPSTTYSFIHSKSFGTGQIRIQI